MEGAVDGEKIVSSAEVKRKEGENDEDVPLQLVIAPPHQLISDVAHDAPRRNRHRHPFVAVPKVGRDLATGADFETVLTGALEEEGKDVEVGVSAGGRGKKVSWNERAEQRRKTNPARK
jgi:hypothetical protein